MIPILYDRTEASFTSNGLGRLSSCIRCIVTEERNGVYECEFDYPVTGVLFSEIEEGRIIACTHDEQGDIQPFDIYGRSEPINGVVTFYAHHISYRQNEITVKPFEAGSATEAIAKIKSQSVNTNPFTYWTNKSVTASFTSEAPKNARDLLMGEEGSMLDVFGTGEYEFDKFNVKLYLHRGQDTNVSIRYGKNLADFQNEYDVSEAYTAVVPYWLGEVSEGEESVQTLVMLPELFISSGHSVPSGREVVVPMDLSDEFEDAPTESELRSTATSRLNSSDAWEANQTVTVDFVQLWQTEEYKEYAPLQRLKLCDTCGVFVPMYDTALRAKVIKVVYNVLLDRYDEMELGDKPTSYAAVLEKQYDSKVAGVVAGFQSIQVDIETAQAIAAADATAKANQAQATAISTASADATSKANQAQQNAISTASADATSKANQAQQNAISTAAADATSKADQAEQNAVDIASADATTKANQAQANAISSANNYTDGQIASTKSTIESQYEQAIEDATELIRGGTGGYVVTTVNANGQPIELLITDNLDLAQAVNVWRWNQGGLAHSSNGYNGQFNDVAITADGKINASMILTGALTANLITAGTITDASGKNSWNLDTGVFTTEQGNVGGYTIDSDGFYAVDNSGNWKNELRIINSTDGSPEIVLRRSNPNGASGIDITPSGITFYSGDDEESLAPYEYFRTVILNNYPALNIGRSNTTGVFFGDPSFDYPISFSLPVTIGNDSRKNFLEIVGSINVVSGAEYKLGGKPLLAGGRVNFGSIATGTYSDQTITFDTAFYNVPHVTACLSTSGTAANIGNVSVSVFGISRTGCTIRVFNNRGGALSPAVEWIAVGV